MAYKLMFELNDVNYLCTATFNRYLNNELMRLFGRRINSFSVFENGRIRCYLHDGDWKVINELLFKDFINNPDKLLKYHEYIRKTVAAYSEFGRKFSARDFFSLTDKELVAAFNEFYVQHAKNHHSGILDALLELHGENITNYIKELLHDRIKKLKLNSEPSEALSVLTTPLEHSHISKEKIDLIKIVLEVIKNEYEKVKINVDSLIDRHHADYSWHGYMYIGPALSKPYFINRLNEYLDERERLLADFEKLVNKKSVKEKKEKLLKELKLDDKTIKQIKIAEEILYMKTLRKDSMVYGWYSADSLMAEISRRIKINRKLAGFLMSYEIEEALLKKKIPDLKKRFKASLIDFQDGEEKIVLGNASFEIEKERAIKKEIANVDSIKGTCAFSGKARGVVKIINKRADMRKFSKGDILVSYATNPDLLPAMEKAAAFVTDRGGLTCHAAIVARELEKPCLVGTEIATKVLKDGDLVEVDAGNEIVHILNKKQINKK